MPFLVYGASRPKFSEFSNGANFEKIPSAQVANFGHFSSIFVQNWVVFVKISKFEIFQARFFQIEGQK